MVQSPPVYISPLDLGPKYVEKMGAGFQEYCKEYGEHYCLGQLIFWHHQTNAEPDLALARARRGCLLLPDLSSFFPTDSAPPLYGPRTVRFMLSRMVSFLILPSIIIITIIFLSSFVVIVTVVIISTIVIFIGIIIVTVIIVIVSSLLSSLSSPSSPSWSSCHHYHCCYFRHFRCRRHHHLYCYHHHQYT